MSGRSGAHLDARAMMEAALRRARRERFSDTSFVEPLRQLLKAYDGEADLSRFGRHAARFDVMRCLDNLLRLDEAEERNPGITARPIAEPVFITGLPRSATSFLHTLMSLDPANVVPRCWQLIYPYPPHRPLLRADFRRARVEFELRLFHLFSPELNGLHPLTADTPQECTDITAQVFQSLRFESTHHIPSYQNWLDGYGHRAAFRFHRRFLQHLDAQTPGRRWILKSPDHVFALDAIRAAYPDARIVFLHRDPLSVVASCAKLSEQLHRPFTHAVDRTEIGRQVSSRLIESTDHMIQAASRSDNILHLHYRQVVASPMDAVRRLYDYCGLHLSVEAERRMQDWLVRPGHRTGRSYSLAEFGLDAAALRDSFARYVSAFSIAAERSGTA